MKKSLLVFLLFASTLWADSVLVVKKGWQLIGSSVPLPDMSKFTSENVTQVWHFDAPTQTWLGFSPESTTQQKMKERGFSPLTSLQNWHGFWIESKQEWVLTLPQSTLTTPPATTQNGDIIQLYKGWNLISLPIDSVVSADIFTPLTVWKYNSNQQWELSDSTQKQTSFPALGHITNADGLWVKADTDQNISVMQEASKLHNFNSTQEMETFVTQMATLYQRPYCGIEPFRMPMIMVDEIGQETVSDAIEAPTTAPSATDDTKESVTHATSTNLQEADVDEADILKHDGTTIFYKVSTNTQASIKLTTFEALANNVTTPFNQITFPNTQNISEMYLVDERLVVLSFGYSPTNTTESIVDIFDVSDTQNILKISSYHIDGNRVTSRVVGDNLYLVSQFSPQISMTYPKIYTTAPKECQEYFEGVNYTMQTNYIACYNLNKEYDSGLYYRYDYENPLITVVDLMPEIRLNETEIEPLITPQRLYASSKQNQNSTLTTVSNFAIHAGSYTQSNSFVGYSSLQYASSKALYLVSNEYPFYYDFTNYKERSNIYKFNLDSNLSYQGLGEVYGHALNQFSLSEYNDILRIATTEGFSWGSDGTQNTLYTLAQESDALQIKGILSGLGKENETIKAVRFMGHRAYIVTFRQTDPLYTIDISDPTRPQKVGELHINGYSDYLHPIGEDKLLGFGRNADDQGRVRGLKLELFDVSDFAHPTSLDTILFADNTSSDLEYNHKALAYRSSDNLFAFPYQSYDYTGYYGTMLNTLGVYQVEGNQLKTYQSLTTPNPTWSEKRGLIFDMNGTTYISFFANDTVITDTLKEK